jgi:hypothetical protein
LSALSAAALISLSALNVISPPASAGSSYSSGASSTPSTPSTSSTPPTASNPPDNKGGAAGGDTTFNLARDVRNDPLTLVICRADRKTADLYFRNSGNTTLPSGMVIHWQVPATGEHGEFTLPRDVKPGDYLPDNGALKATLGPDGKCQAKLQ